MASSVVPMATFCTHLEETAARVNRPVRRAACRPPLLTPWRTESMFHLALSPDLDWRLLAEAKAGKPRKAVLESGNDFNLSQRSSYNFHCGINRPRWRWLALSTSAADLESSQEWSRDVVAVSK